MKAKYRNILIGTAIASILGVSGAAIAHGGGNWQQGAQGCQGGGPAMGMGGRGMGMMGGMMKHDGMMGGMQHGMGQGFGGMGPGLDLSTEQRAEMGKIRQEFLPLMGELRGRMQANHEQIRALRQGGEPDQAAIDKLAEQKGDLITEMIKLRTQHQARMQALLTDEQREQMRQHRQGRGMMGMGPMGG